LEAGADFIVDGGEEKRVLGEMKSYITGAVTKRRPLWKMAKEKAVIAPRRL